MKFLATFAYTADVLPKGSRKQRREVLFAKTELEIADLSPSDLAIDAVVVTTRPRANEEERRAAFAGYDGRLWTPLRVNPTFAGGSKSTAPYFLKSCELPWPAGSRNDNPLSSAYDGELYDAGNSFRSGGGGIGRHTEEDYDGKVVDVSRRLDAIERCRRIAADIVNVDGTIYIRRPEPVWEIPPERCTDVFLREAPDLKEGVHRFRLDRLAEAREWLRRSYRGQFDAIGAIERYDPIYVTRDDLSHFLTGHLRPILEGPPKFLPYMDSSQVAAWHRLAQVKDRTGSQFDAPFPLLPLDQALADLRWLCSGLTDARLPGSYLAVHDKFLREELTPFMARLDFEMARRPAPSAEDEAAFARLGSP